MIRIIVKHFSALWLTLSLFLTTLISCSPAKQSAGEKLPASKIEELHDSISSIAARYPGEIGVALIIDNTDTITVNNEPKYPMMSVFKLHQAIALCDYFDSSNMAIDSLLILNRDNLDANTWSPMLKDNPAPQINISVRDLIRYALIQSDNNASNILFRHFANTQYTDSLIADIIPRESFRIEYSEEEMAKDHSKAYANYTSPLGAAMLINRLFTDSIVSPANQTFLKTALGECNTGKDRIVAPLEGKAGVTVAHKTGSGYRTPDGRLAAHNDVAFISLPNNTAYSLAVFVKDFNGNEEEAAEAIARISAVVYQLTVNGMNQ